MDHILPEIDTIPRVRWENEYRYTKDNSTGRAVHPGENGTNFRKIDCMHGSACMHVNSRREFSRTGGGTISAGD